MAHSLDRDFVLFGFTGLNWYKVVVYIYIYSCFCNPFAYVVYMYRILCSFIIMVLRCQPVKRNSLTSTLILATLWSLTVFGLMEVAFYEVGSVFGRGCPFILAGLWYTLCLYAAVRVARDRRRIFYFAYLLLAAMEETFLVWFVFVWTKMMD